MAKISPTIQDMNNVITSGVSFRNRVINGSCVVAQRGSVAIASNTFAYGGCDRIAVQTGGFTTVSGTISQGGGVGSGVSASGYVQQFQATTTGSGTIGFVHRIEAANCADLNGKTVTLSVSLYQDTGSTLSPTLNLYKPTAVDNYTGQTFLYGTGISLPTSTRTKFTWTVTLGSTDASNGLAIVINFPVGAVSGKYFQIADLQLEKGSVATAFEQRPIGLELSLCQRYYYQCRHAIGTIGSLSTSLWRLTSMHPVAMRISPTTTLVGTPTIQPGYSPGVSITALGTTYHNTIAFQVDCTIASTAAASGTVAILQNNNSSANYIDVSAEL